MAQKIKSDDSGLKKKMDWKIRSWKTSWFNCN